MVHLIRLVMNCFNSVAYVDFLPFITINVISCRKSC
jgi:hypothetical protein